MDISLTEAERSFYDILFNLVDVEKVGKLNKLKSDEFFRSSSEIDNDILMKIYQLACVSSNSFYLTRSQFYSCLKLISAYQSNLQLREEILTSSSIQVPLPKFSWKLELEPPPEVIDPSLSAIKPKEQAQNGLLVSPDLIELSSAKESHLLNVDVVNSDIPSTDSEVEQTDTERETTSRNKKQSGSTLSSGKHHHHHHHGKTKRSGSPTWSTASESPTPTNSTHNSVGPERPWAINSQSWQGLLCEEQRQLLGTEEESSDKHSSDEDEDDLDLEALYQITSEQREYYLKQFRTVQPDVSGLLSGVVARIFFEKSRIPVEELRHIWQLCDVTRDGALDVAEFTAAMHLVVLRRNNIPIPSVLPTCLQPHVLCKTLGLPLKEPTAEADLLHLESDNDNQDSSNVTATHQQQQHSVNKKDYQRMISSTYDEYKKKNTSSSGKSISSNKSSTLPKNHFSTRTSSSEQRGEADGSSVAINNNNNNLNSINNNNKQMNLNKNVISTINRSGSNSPSLPQGTITTTSVVDGKGSNENSNNKEWTKFTESPTSNVSSPGNGPKPVNVTQAIVSDPSHVIHPVPLRVTPVGTEIAEEEALRTFRKADTLVYESGVIKAQHIIMERDESSPRLQQQFKKQPSLSYQRDSLPNDLRAIQRPHPKKPASKNIGQIPLPPLAADSNNLNINQVTVSSSSSGNSVVLKKEVPPLPPPRPHRHTRSSSLDLQKFKVSQNGSQQQQQQQQPPLPETASNSSQPPELPPPRISEKNFKMPSVDTYIVVDSKNDESFADFNKQFPDSKHQKSLGGEQYVTTIRLDNPPIPQPRLTLTNSLIGSSSNGGQRSSAFEVYRKPSRSPPSNAPNEAKIQEYEKQVLAISENLKQVKFPRGNSQNEQSPQDLLKYLKEQNSLLICLCNDLSDELLGVQKKKEEIRVKLTDK